MMFVVAAARAHRAAAQASYGGQPFPQQPQFNPNNFIMPGPPADTGTVTRPSAWPGGPGPDADPPPRRPVRSANRPLPPAGSAAAAGSPTGVATSTPPGAPAGGAPGQQPPRAWAENAQSLQYDLTDFSSAKVIAIIGPEVIQDYEVNAYVDEIIEQNAARIPPNQLAKVREKLTKDRLNHLIEIKLALVDAQRKVPPDSYPKIMDSMADEFEKNEVKNKFKELKVNSRGELDAKLREQGSSLDRKKQEFVEQNLAFGWVREQTKIKHEATHQDLLAYYLEHIEDYSFRAKARWEELRVKVSNYPNRQAAAFALGEMGNSVWRGANFADVARARSQGPNASAGGLYDWTTQGSMASEIVDKALFAQEVGRLGPILDDGRGPTMSIVRVIERTDAGRRPFTEVQKEIKEKLAAAHTEKEKAKIHEYIAKLRAETPVWTIYDGEATAEGEGANENQVGRRPASSSTSLRPASPNGAKQPPANPYLR